MTFGRVQTSLWPIKGKSSFKQRYSKILLTPLIKTQFIDQLSSLGSNPQIKTFILLDFSHKQEPMLTMPSAISVGQSGKRLLVPHNITTFFSDGGIGRIMADQSTFSTWSPPAPEFYTFKGVKYLCHNFTFLERPAIMESPSNKMFVNCF